MDRRVPPRQKSGGRLSLASSLQTGGQIELYSTRLYSELSVPCTIGCWWVSYHVVFVRQHVSSHVEQVTNHGALHTDVQLRARMKADNQSQSIIYKQDNNAKFLQEIQYATFS